MHDPSAPTGTPPRFSLVSAVYNVSRYLPEFIASIESQDFDLDQVEVIAVDDGSTDDSLAILQAWQERRPELVRVFTKPNGGQGSARNLGLEQVSGEWVTFPDPDDMLEPDYLSRVEWAINKWPKLAMVAAARIMYFDDIGEIADRHRLRKLFRRDQLVNLDQQPEFFHNSAPAAFFRTSDVARHGLRFDERIRPNFEDGHFSQRYLLRAGEPLVAFLRTARYLYRRRFDQTSTLQTGHLQASRFLAVPRHGYLELLQEGAAGAGGRAPRWLQNMVIYELSRYLIREDDAFNSGTACHGEVAEQFLELLRAIRRHLDDDAIQEFSSRRLRPEWRQVLLRGLAEPGWHTPYVVAQRYDEKRKQVLLSFRFTGDEPSVELLVRGRTIEPAATKVRALSYWDHILLRERLMWVPATGALKVLLAGQPVELQTEWSEHKTTVLRPAAIRRLFVETPDIDPREAEDEPVEDRTDRLVARLAASAPVTRLFGNAWVLMDRMDEAGDSAERLFRHLRAKNRDINAWFVVAPGSPGYARLRKEGYRRIVGYGTRRWKLLMVNCVHLISSHADAVVRRPPLLQTVLPDPAWKFTFLQHGVIGNDISSYLNDEPVDLMVTGSVAEHASIVGDETPYVLTPKEVKRTGLPRFDRLRLLGEEVPEADQMLILVAPTWRNWLVKPLRPGSDRRALIPELSATEYVENWFGLLRSDLIGQLCEEQGLRLGFLPHPNLQEIVTEVALPPHVDALSYADDDAQALFARAAVTVTDYSSIAFDSAYINRPVVYFQFDRQRVDRGDHLGRRGYFDYERDGFGAVAYTLADAERAVVDTLGRGRRTQPPYDARIVEAFPDRDGNCCKRVIRQIRAL